jgi:hypothetical protein
MYGVTYCESNYELHLQEDVVIKVSRFKPQRGRDIIVGLLGLEFDNRGNPIRFSSTINFYKKASSDV